MYKEFEICQVFEKIQTEKVNAKANDFPEEKQGEFIIPLLTAGIQNQGLARYAKLKQCPTILKNVLSVSANGANSGAVFYQPDEFAVLQDAYAVKPINHEIQNEAEGLFLATALNKAIRENHDWTNKAGWNNIKNDLVSLPILSDGSIDWNFMTEQIQKLEMELILRLESQLAEWI